MNHTRLPKEVLPDWARRDMQGTKGDRVQYVLLLHFVNAQIKISDTFFQLCKANFDNNNFY
jgi:hypothetical protein